MKTMLRIGLFAMVGVGCLLLKVAGEDAPKHKFMGVANCKMCHSKDDVGAQFKIWSESKHAHAFEVLGTEQAKKDAEAKGVKGNPQEAPECLKCHTTAFGVAAEFLDKKFNPQEGVQCEACHGPAGDYWKKEVMKDKAKAIENGLIIPDEKVCKGCHNPESPNYKEFNFEEFFKKIAHPNPNKPK